jgi:hypothetical protein
MFGRKRRERESGPPVGLNDMHDFATPSDSAPYVDARHTYASRIGKVMPRIPHQDELLIHDDRPPADQPPGPWYRDYGGKEWGDWSRSQAQELPQGTGPGFPFQPERVTWTGNPNQRPPAPSRLMRAPSHYSMVRDMNGGSARHLSGLHASMATIDKTYQPLGMTPAYRNRNTFRMDPPPRDAYIVDMPSNADAMNRTVDSVYVSPDLPSAPSGLNRSFRLS